MQWSVEYTNEFESWWKTLTQDEQEDVTAFVTLLEERGPQLPFPFTVALKTLNTRICVN